MGMSDSTPRTESARQQYDRDVFENTKGFCVAEPVHADFARQLESELAEANARLQNIPALLENSAKLRRELAEANAYADKLAQGLPCLPSDVENLRQANLDLANELAEAKAELKMLKQVEAFQGMADVHLYTELEKDSERLDWLLSSKKVAIRDHVTSKMAFVLEEGREIIDAAMEGNT